MADVHMLGVLNVAELLINASWQTISTYLYMYVVLKSH